MTVFQKIGKYVGIFLKYFSLVFFSFVAVLPVVSCVITAFKTDTEYQQTNVMVMPESWLNFDNFIQAFQRANMGRAFINSTIILVCVLVVSTIVGTQLAYVLNRFKFPGNGLIRNLFLFASLLPGVAMQVAVYEIMYKLGFINSLIGYIIMMCGTDVISIYIYIQFFENIPISLDESGIVDGVYLRRTSRKQIQSDLCGGYHFPVAGFDRIYYLPETDLQRTYLRCSKRVIRNKENRRLEK